eukprot:1161363-Pelagomonas_calceolata.AAC.4
MPKSEVVADVMPRGGRLDEVRQGGQAVLPDRPLHTCLHSEGAHNRTPKNRPGTPSCTAHRDKCKAEALAAAGIDCCQLAAASKELSELDLGDWNPSMAEAAAFLKKRDYRADPAQLQVIESTKPDYLHNFWLPKANPHFPLLAIAANKLLSAYTTIAAAEWKWSVWARIRQLAQPPEH